MDWLIDDGASPHRIIEKRPYTLNYYLPYLEYWDDGGEFQRQNHSMKLELVLAEMKELWASKERIIARCKTIKEDLMMHIWNPDRMETWWLSNGFDPDD